jgi:hypothetical protein
MFPNENGCAHNLGCPNGLDRVNYFLILKPLRVKSEGGRAIVQEGLKVERYRLMI